MKYRTMTLIPIFPVKIVCIVPFMLKDLIKSVQHRIPLALRLLQLLSSALLNGHTARFAEALYRFLALDAAL